MNVTKYNHDVQSNMYIQGTGYEYDGNIFIAWVLKVRRFPDMDTYFAEINHVLLASRGYEYDEFLFS